MTNSRKLICVITAVISLTHSLAHAIDNGVFTIESKYSNKFVEVTNALQSNAANIAQWYANGHNTQKWLITRVSADDYSIINLNSGKALEVYAKSTTDGANIVQYEFNGGASQLWKINDEGNGFYSFINRHSGKAMDLYNFQTSNGANIGQWTYFGNDAQLWSLTKLANVESTPWDPSVTNGAQNHWSLSGNLVTHDPTIGYENGTWWLFQTGPGIYGKWSSNGVDWNGAAPIFPYGLSWWANYVPEQEGVDVWAPELKFYNGKAWLYYAVSTFGSRVSAIGLASTTSISSGN
jgi:arabinan endo-1,5-alpha-L-arabinosidase